VAEYARRKGRRLLSQINVVPYIDVMLVLLVIFMVTAPLITTSVVDLPSVSRSSTPPVVPMQIVIRNERTILLCDPECGRADRPVSLDELVTLVREKQQQAPDRPVVIAAGKDLPYGKVVEIMDLLERNQVTRIGLLAKPNP